MYWYDRLYREQFRNEPQIARGRVLEIGSGTSPLKHFMPDVLTSDILELDYLDIIFDCHAISDFSGIPDHSLDVITMTNVLHHLRDPLAFLRSATRKLAQGAAYMSWNPTFPSCPTPCTSFCTPNRWTFASASLCSRARVDRFPLLTRRCRI